MNFAIKILHESRHRAIRKINGYSGTVYIFKWHEGARAYVYEPANQQEVDDIYRTQGRTTVVYFSPVDLKAPEKPKVAAAPDASLTDYCVANGIAFTEDDSEDTLRRLVGAHSNGRMDERAIRTVYEGAMVKVGLVPAELPAQGYFNAEQMEAHIASFLNRMTELPAAESEKSPDEPPAPVVKSRKKERAAAAST